MKPHPPPSAVASIQYATGRPSGSLWPALVVGLLVANAIGVAALVVAAARDPSHYVEPNYYNKAVAWDLEMAQQRMNQRLGWKLDVVAVGNAEALLLSLVDAQGQPMTAVSVSILAWHKARASKRRRARCELTRGQCKLSIGSMRPGIWAIKIDIERVQTDGTLQRFTAHKETEIERLGTRSRSKR